MKRLLPMAFDAVLAEGRLGALTEAELAQRAAFAVAMPFRVNPYVLNELIDWEKAPDDPFFRVYFGSTTSFTPSQRALLERATRELVEESEQKRRWRAFYESLHPHPGDQLQNVPVSDDGPVKGVQHKYKDTVLYFPREGQTCHAYCAFCFRWPQFVDGADHRFEADGPERLLAYLRAHPEVSDVVLTGGDPLVMKASVLAKHVEPIARAAGNHVRTLRIGTRSVAHWPSRFVDATDADELIALLTEVAREKRVVLMLHTLHPRELEPVFARTAIDRLLKAGIELRMQGAILRGVNDDPATLCKLWTRGQQLGLVPYYLFGARMTGPHAGYAVPLVEALATFEAAYRELPGLAKTVRGPVLSTAAGKVHIVGELGGSLVLRYLRARDSSLEGPLFLASPRPGALWIDDLVPVDDHARDIFRRAGVGARDSGPVARLASEVSAA